ncbi:MAG: CDP-alcohol phosphatidyltransferase family protein [Acetobacteraceae bacterium]|nr:CDP-alcohol phosphatidyltransferase family protein [Acetobacteraceae bacterium]
MIDRHVLPMLSRVLSPLAGGLIRLGATADAITSVGLCLGLAAAGLIAAGQYQAGLAAFIANRLCDGLDGAVARRLGPTDRGAFIDIAGDFVIYAALPFGFALADPASNALAAAALLFGFMGTASSFLGFAVIAAKRGMTSAAYPTKGFYYLGGLTEGSETIGFFVAVCLWPGWFGPLAWGFGGLCALTTVTRWVGGIAAFKPTPPPRDRF